MSFDKQITLSPEQLSDLGFDDVAQAVKNLELLRGRLGAEDFSGMQRALLSGLSGSADPDMALNNLERFATGLTDVPFFVSLCRDKREVLPSLITLFGASRFLSSFLVASPDDGLQLFADPAALAQPAGQARLAGRLERMLESGNDENSFYHAIRLFRKREMLRIALADLLGRADLQETVSELSDLAEVCLKKACEWADAVLRRRHGTPVAEGPDATLRLAGFAVIAMGKLGGRELNFSSDVDLMYVYAKDGETEGALAPDGGVTGRITNHQYFIKLAEKLSAAINEKTEDGFVFRVDLRLRPEGQRGPLAQSLGGYEIYYESWGQTWERSALIKARPVAGDEGVGGEFMQRISPFVFRKYLDFNAIAEIREMKRKINKDVELKGRTHRDVKLGYGGIREIEFVVQALQLIYAGGDRSLRERNALKALHTLSRKGLITYQEHDDLAKAYVFLRTVEHRLQVLDDLQTQILPHEERELRALARRAGYLERGRETELLLRDYASHTQKVRGIYDDLFAFTGEEAVPEGRDGDFDRLIDPDATEQDITTMLADHGFREPGKAYRNLLLLREGSAFVHQTPRGRKLFNELFPSLFREIVNSPDPDMALNHLESFLAAQGSWDALQSLVKLDVSAAMVLIAIFANSEYLSRMLVSRPSYLQNLLEARRALGSGICAVFARELGEALDKAVDITDKLDALRRFKHQEEIRVGMADLLSNSAITGVSRDLSKLAEVCLRAAFDLAVADATKRFRGSASFSGLAIIGVGKLGGRELIYGSDLDILFVFSEDRTSAPPAGMTVSEYFSKVAEKTISYLSTLTREGFVFRVDTRLRPTGSKGPLVQSINAFRNYYAGQAETWERQALLRARFVAGDPAVGGEFRDALQDLIYRDTDRTALAHDVVNMRKRMQEEVGRENAASYNIKQGEGGLVDVEFLVQFLQLLYGRRHRWVRVPGTYNALRALRKEKLLPPDDYRMLARAYLFIRKLESRMRIVSNQATSELSRDPVKLQPLARRMGYADENIPAGAQLLQEYQEVSARVREVFEKVVR